MPNSYYNRNKTFVPDTRALSRDVNDEYSLVEDGFDLLPIPSVLGKGFGEVVHGVSPSVGSHLATKAYVDLAVNTAPITRRVDAGTGLVGGGDMSADRVISVANNGITDALLRTGAATSIIGRSAGSVGNVADIAATADGQFLRRVSGALVWGVLASGDITGALGYTPVNPTALSAYALLSGASFTGPVSVSAGSGGAANLFGTNGTAPASYDAGQVLGLANNSTAGGDKRLIMFGQAPTSGDAYIRAGLSGPTPVSVGLRIVTGNADRLVVDVGGRLGLGVLTPSNWYGNDSLAVFGRNQNAETILGLQNATVGAAASASIRTIGGTTNSFSIFRLNDGNGTPTYDFAFGAGVTSVRWLMNGSSAMTLNQARNWVIPAPASGVALTAVGGASAALDVSSTGSTLVARIGRASGDAYLAIDSAAGTSRSFRYRTGTSPRWEFGAGNLSESGSNAGSDFFINRYDDAGAYLSTPLFISRATGAWSIAAPSSGDALTLPASVAGGAPLTLPHGVAPTTPVNGNVWTTTAGLFARINGATVGPFGTGGGGTPAGANREVQINNSGAFGGSALSITSTGDASLGSFTSATYGGYRALEVARTGNALMASTSNGQVFLNSNAYYDGTNWRYGNTGRSGYAWLKDTGGFAIATAVSGTTGNIITFSAIFDLDVNGRAVTRDLDLTQVSTLTSRIRIASNGAAVGSASMDIGQGWGSASDGIGWLLSRGGDMLFGTGGTERARISNTDGTFIHRSATNNSTASLIVENSGAANFGLTTLFQTTAGTDNPRIAFRNFGSSNKQWSFGSDADGVAWFENGGIGSFGTRRMRLAGTQPLLYLYGDNPTMWWQDSDHRAFAIHVNGNLAYFMRGGVNDPTWTPVTNANGTSVWPMMLLLDSGALEVASTGTFGNTVTALGAGDANTGASMECMSTGSGGGATAANIRFHRPGNYGIMLSLRTDNVFGLGGWSQGNNVWRWTSDSGGNFVALGNVTAYSDERLKSNWSSFKLSLSQILNIPLATFTRKDTGERQIGTSAQRLQDMIPLAVMKDRDGMLSVDYGRAAMAIAVSLAQEVALLKAKLDAAK